jgi:hypothetical protein
LALCFFLNIPAFIFHLFWSIKLQCSLTPPLFNRSAYPKTGILQYKLFFAMDIYEKINLNIWHYLFTWIIQLSFFLNLFWSIKPQCSFTRPPFIEVSVQSQECISVWRYWFCLFLRFSYFILELIWQCGIFVLCIF